MAHENESREVIHSNSLARRSFLVKRVAKAGTIPAAMMTRKPTLERTSIPIDACVEATLVRRYKRFLADVELPGGEKLTIHCPNPGSMMGLQTAGSAVRCSTSENPKRKLRHTLEMIRVGRTWVGLHAQKANSIAERALQSSAYSPFSGYSRIDREISIPEGSRFDFRLSEHPRTSAPCWIEVKSVTLCEGRNARFPDAVTERGRRHLDHLVSRLEAGDRAALLFIVQRSDADSVAPADEIDPQYGAALRSAVDAGVEVHALGARVQRRRIILDRILPVLL